MVRIETRTSPAPIFAYVTGLSHWPATGDSLCSYPLLASSPTTRAPIPTMMKKMPLTREISR